MNNFVKMATALACTGTAFYALKKVFRPAELLDENVNRLRPCWKRGNGPEINGIDIDYSYFSPVENGASPDKKYPLIIVMAGALEGLQEGFELYANNMPKWSGEEYQSRFTEKNAFMFIARAPEESRLYWDSTTVTPSLKAAIDDFCAKNPNVNTDRIYIVGWCLGGNGAINLSTSYPNDFAAAIIMCPNRPITVNEAEALKNMPVWFMGSKTDTHIIYPVDVLASYRRLRKASSRKADVRLTSYRKAPDVTLLDWIPFILNHNVWNNVADDLHTKKYNYHGMKTIDGNRHRIKDPYAISWLDSFTLADGREKSQARDKSRLDYRLNIAINENLQTEMRVQFFRVLLSAFAKLGWI